MKHILILNYEYPPVGGGAGVITQYLAERLAANNLTITVVTTYMDGLPETETVSNLTIIRLKSKRELAYKSTPIEMFDWVLKCIRYFKTNAALFDIAICNFSIPGGIVGRFLKRKFGIPYVIISHGHDIPFFYPQKMLVYHLPLFLYIYYLCRGADKIISLTTKLQLNANKFVKNKADSIMIPNGIDTKKFAVKQIEKGDTLHILFAGRLVSQKNPLMLLKALARINDRIKFTATILGNGLQMDSLKKFVENNGMQNSVFFKGKVPYEEMPGYYASSDVYIMTSTHEAMPLTLIEAVCTGNYIVTTPVSGTDELVFEGKNGTLVHHNDDTKLAEIIEQLAKKKASGNLLVNSKYVDDIRSEFAIESVVNKYFLLIENVCKNN